MSTIRLGAICWLLPFNGVMLTCVHAVQAPRDKLVCILNCCRVINNLLHVGIQDGQARGESRHAAMLRRSLHRVFSDAISHRREH